MNALSESSVVGAGTVRLTWMSEYDVVIWVGVGVGMGVMVQSWTLAAPD